MKSAARQLRCGVSVECVAWRRFITGLCAMGQSGSRATHSEGTPVSESHEECGTGTSKKRVLTQRRKGRRNEEIPFSFAFSIAPLRLCLSLFIRASFLLKARDGWGADPHGHMRISVENPKWYRFDGSYRRFKYFRFLNTLANPNWVFSPPEFSVPPNPVTGEHGFDTKQQLGDFDLTILPKNELIRFNVGFSPERYSGPAFTNYHIGGNEFHLLSELRSRADDFRVGADGKLGPIDYSFMQGFRRFRDDSFIDLGRTPGINLNPTTASLNSIHRDEPTRGKVNYTRLSLHSLVAQRLAITARYIYSNATSNSLFSEGFTGVNWNARVSGFPPTPPNSTPNTLNLGTYNITQDVERPNTIGDVGITWLATRKLRISNTFRIEDFEINGLGSFSDFFSITRPISGGARTDTVGFNNLWAV